VERARVGGVPAQRAGDHAGPAGLVAQRIGDRPGQQRVRGDLREGPQPVPRGGGHRRGEADRLPQVGRPVGGVEHRRGARVVQRRGVAAQPGGPRPQPGQGGGQLTEQRIHLRGVPGALGLQHPGGAAAAADPAGQLGDLRGVPGDHALDRRGDDGQVHAGQARGQLGRLVRWEPHQRHRPRAGQPGQQAGPGRDHLRPVGNGQRAADHGGGHLAHGVADDRHGTDAVFLPGPGQRHLDGEQRGLGVPHVAQRGGVPEHLAQ